MDNSALIEEILSIRTEDNDLPVNASSLLGTETNVNEEGAPARDLPPQIATSLLGFKGIYISHINIYYVSA